MSFYAPERHKRDAGCDSPAGSQKNCFDAEILFVLYRREDQTKKALLIL